GDAAALDESAGVDARRRVAMEEDDVAVVVLALALEEMIEADLVQRRRRCVGRDVPADAVLRLVRLDDHSERVPAHEALDAPLDLTAAGARGSVCAGQPVESGTARRERVL